MSLPVGLRAWRVLTGMASPFARLLLRRRATRDKEDWTRLNERLGMAGLARPEGRLVWIHGASVGESLSALPLIETLQQHASVLVTSGTVTSAAMMGQRLPTGALHQFVPLDMPGAVKRFLDHWKPDAGLFIESDLWPNLILGAASRGVKLALVNARISARSAERWGWAKNSMKRLLSSFDMVLAQDDDGAARFRALGARTVEVVGSLKADAPPLGCDEAALAELKQQIGNRPVLLAAQTHPGEDETVLPAHDLLRVRFPELLTILVPRHTARGADLEMLCGTRAWKRRSSGGRISPQTAVYIADTMGELGLFYRLSRFCFLGGTLVPLGGHNVLEPAALHCAVLAGPNTANAARAFEAASWKPSSSAWSPAAPTSRAKRRACWKIPLLPRRQGMLPRAGAATQSGAVARTAAALAAMLDARA